MNRSRVWLISTVGLAVVITSCVSQGRGEGARPPDDPGAVVSVAVDAQDPAIDQRLLFRKSGGSLACDGTGHEIGLLDNARPGEAINFSIVEGPLSGLTVSRAGTGVADSTGTAVVKVSCEGDDVGGTWTVMASATESRRTASFEVSAEDVAVEGDVEVTLVENPFLCDRVRRPIARLDNLRPRAGVTVVVSQIESSDGDGDVVGDNGAGEALPSAIDELRPGAADSSGSLDLFWTCERLEATTTWTLVATEKLSAGELQEADEVEPRTVTFSFTGSTTPNPTTVDYVEDPFVCDGTRHVAAVLANFVPGEFIDFSSPDADSLRQGQALPNGTLPVNWQCEAADADRTWAVTATGETSGASLNFTITGSPPPES